MVTVKDAKEITFSIVKALHPVSVVLFGSVAREGAGTDLDLLIITDDKEGSPDDLHRRAQRCLKNFYRKFAIDPFVVPASLLREHYAKGSPFLRSILKEGRLLYMRDIVAGGLKQAEEDLKAAEYLSKGGFFRSACFHSQQAIEKIIKAHLLKKGWELEKIHNVRRIVSICKDFHIQVAISDEEITFIDSIYRGRYPAEAGLLPLGEPSREDAKQAAAIASRILKDMQHALKK